MRRTQRLCVWQWMVVLTVTAATVGADHLHGQTGRGIGADTGTLVAPPMLRMWNWPDTVFLTGAYGTAELLAPSGKAADIWDFLDAMGLSLYVTHLYHEPNNTTDSLRWLRYIDTLSWSADVVSGHRFTVYDAGILTDQMGQGRAVEFYPFDSVQSVWFPFRFMERQGGANRTNKYGYGGADSNKTERFYNTTNTTPGTVIAENIAFNQWDNDAMRINRWPSQGGEPMAQVVDRWFWDDAARGDPQGGPRIDTVYYVVVAGHLFEGGTSLDTDSLLKIDIIYEVPQGAKFHPGVGPTTQTAPTDTTFPVTTLYVRKVDLYPDTSVFPVNWDEYHEVVLPIDLRYLANGAWGPTKDSSDCSRRFDIRVTWLGGEQLAVRSISLRDIHGQLSLGTDVTAKAWRQQRINLMRRLLYGANNYSLPEDSLRRAWFGLYPGEEQHATAWAGMETMINILRDTFNVARPGFPGERDSVGTWSAQYFLNDMFHQHSLSTPEFVGVETYLWTLPLQGTDSIRQKDGFNLRYEELPSIREENGGRFRIGEIDLDDPSSLEEYEKTLQRSVVGRYMPSWDHLPSTLWQRRWGLLHHLGDAARISRATGRRLIQLPSVNSNLDLQLYEDSTGVWHLDTLIGHIPTEAELRMVTNLGLAYGAKGAVYWWLTSSANAALVDTLQPNGDTIWGLSIWANGTKIEGFHYGGGFGPVGSEWDKQCTNDTVRDFDSAWTFHRGTAWPLVTIPDMYVGFGVRTRAMKRVNQRLREIGKKMMDLTWRESYSVHYTTEWPLDTAHPEMLQYKSRPFDPDEIIQEVTAEHPVTGAKDSAWATFVEIGLFDPVTDTTGGVYDPLKTKHYVYLVNRRAFQRPDWISDTTARGRKMDSLAESRLIHIRWNLKHPDSTQYPLIRVREILPPSDTIPLIGPRHVLDTVISGVDSVSSILLSAGSATLLEVSFPTPDTTLLAGDLRWPGQKKLIWDKFRYYSVYGTTRPDGSGGTVNVIAMRMSYPMADSTGSIVWIPQEFILSDPLFPNDTIVTDNRFPSFTLHRQGLTTWLSAVWTCHKTGSSGDREVVLRNVMVKDYTDIVNPIGQPPLPPYTWAVSPLRIVDWYRGPDAEQWGTPVVGFTHGGVMIAWSDSSLGIVGRLFPKDFTTWTGGAFNPTFSARDSITWADKQSFGYAAQYPSVPPWTPRTRTDSTIGITWRQPRLTRDDIRYNRLVHTAADAMVNLNPGSLSIASWNAKRWYPSIDIIPDTATGIQREGIVWEDDFQSLKVVYFQSLLTPISGITALSNRAYYVVMTDDSVTTWPNGEIFPQTAVLGEHDTASGAVGSAQFAVGYQVPKTPPDLWQALVDWDSTSFRSGWPQQYSYGGRHPNVAANLQQLWPRNAILYQANDVGGSDSTLRTSRQFFAKHARPVGYAASGRDVRFRIDDSSGTGFHVLFYDPWFADAHNAAGLPMVYRSATLAVTDSIGQVAGLFRTDGFATSDSVTIGCRLFASFHGDSALAAGERVDLIVELVDSVTGDVVAELDSITVSAAEDESALQIERTLDLLSGTYYVRLRFASPSFPSESVAYDCLYPVAEVAGWIANPLAAKGVRRLAGDAEAGLRVAAQPNPFTGETEIRFSVGRNEHVTLKVYDAYGREVRSLIGKEFYPSGRYAIALSGTDLLSGTYLVELRTLNGRVAEKIILQR